MRLVIVVVDVLLIFPISYLFAFFMFSTCTVSATNFPGMNFIGISPFFHCDFMCVNSKMMFSSQKNRFCSFVVADPSRYYR